MSTTGSSSGLAAVALAVAAAGVVVSGVAFGEVRALRADVEALRAPAASAAAVPAPSSPPPSSPPPSSSMSMPFDLSPWSALPAPPAVRVRRALFENTDELVQSMRVVPAFEQGMTIGFKIFSVREGSPFAQVGIQNGDVLVAANGLPLATPDQALAVNQQLRTAPLVTLSIRRRGVPVRIDVAFE